MEENQNTTTSSVNPAGESPSVSGGVSFPTVGGAPKKSAGKTFLVIGVLILVAVLGYVIYKSAADSSEDISTEPTPYDNLTAPIAQSPAPSASSTATPKAVSKDNVKIQVQNGTGIAGEAAYLQTQLKALGYTEITAGNAPSQEASATVVTFSTKLAQSVIDELTKKLNSIYETVTVKNSASATTDVVIITGLRKGATPKASASPTGTPRATATPTATPSGQ